MEQVYTIIFWVGVIYTVITFLIGSLFDFVHFDSHIDTHTIFPLKPITIVSFITVFGGIGIIGTSSRLNAIFTFIIAFATGIIVSFILYRLILIPLYKAQNTSAVSQDALIGMKAIVISPILEDGFGVIAYIVNGNKYNAPAQHVGKSSIPLSKTEKIVIVDSGSGEGKGASKVTGYVSDIMSQLPETVEAITGVNIMNFLDKKS
ncbi:hypothetical protein HGI79_13545 [Clostridium sp. DJ247]|nr:hypothetical protein [Clostridium sp. DJ247]